MRPEQKNPAPQNHSDYAPNAQNNMPPAPEPERPSLKTKGQKELWCPFAERAKPVKDRGEYPKKYPEGAVVHWTSGSSAQSSMDWGREKGYMFFMIARDGTIHQPNPLNVWGYHAGESSYKGLGSSLSNRLVGIEIDSCGKVEKLKDGKGKSWFGRLLGNEQCREVPKKANMAAGLYEKFTAAQELALENLLLWLKENNPEVFKLELVLGHDEIAPGRKTDPGGSLSMTMPDFRAHLQAEYEERNKSES